MRCVRSIIGKRRRPDEAWVAFIRRTAHHARALWASSGVQPFVACALQRVRGWAGLLARQKCHRR
eukprot:10212450-Alexandrium_andersonii.AAC.1